MAATMDSTIITAVNAVGHLFLSLSGEFSSVISRFLLKEEKIIIDPQSVTLRFRQGTQRFSLD